MEEYFFECPYCWESISMLIDLSVSHQEYIEDCEVCCNPIQMKIQIQNSKILNAESLILGQ
ncbi:MAG: CPXCG motif-containing cysteine-rich protein [Flavobacteriaceae bacterium]|nr:CPXCG motif-containing cysteine-rich protein [Bacteroidia bacterium]MBT8287246.1 CPXCG motif-containing cysteine-rich protein [Bacteroidia bacterium]NNF75604.1 CPXCG motif-containing cysteine-rich protein [Flavobacteriaceae bacterium]NNK74395.1 CPXCG motif-containing cysteine-rich protein [Flavobacteriaceae bacterium]